MPERDPSNTLLSVSYPLLFIHFSLFVENLELIVIQTIVSNIDSDEIETFAIEQNNGRVKLTKSLDSVHRNHYRLVVKAEDDSDPPKSDTTEVSFAFPSTKLFLLF